MTIYQSRIYMLKNCIASLLKEATQRLSSWRAELDCCFLLSPCMLKWNYCSELELVHLVKWYTQAARSQPESLNLYTLRMTGSANWKLEESPDFVAASGNITIHPSTVANLHGSDLKSLLSRFLPRGFGLKYTREEPHSWSQYFCHEETSGFRPSLIRVIRWTKP